MLEFKRTTMEEKDGLCEKRLLSISTPCFKEGDWIPDNNAGYGEDQSPEFHIEGIDPEAVTMILTLDDLGHPLEPGYNHWIAWNIDPVECIPGDLPKGSVLETPIHMEQGMAYGKHCYRGPKPPFNWNHEYLFTLYTLDCRLHADKNSKRDDILRLAAGHILQKAEIRGKYQRRHD